MQQSSIIRSPRIEVVDALRGFAVLAILLVHHVEHFIYPVYPDPATLPGWLNVLDEGVFTVVFALFAGKSYSVFALLFGFTFYIQYTNQLAKGKDFGYRFLWRLLLLTVFATLNAAFYPAGDVLLLYAFVGIVLFIVRKWSDKAVLITAVIMLLQPVEWFHYIASLFNPEYTLPNLGVGEMYAEMAEHTKKGDFWNFLWQNITLGQEASLLWAVGAGRYMQTIGLFLLGLLIGRKKLFVPTEENNRFWLKVLVVTAVAFGPLYQLKVLLLDNAETALVRQTAGVAFDMWQKFAFTFVLVASFVLFYQRESVKRFTSNLRFYGKMSLTNYVSQSIAGAIIYFPIGFNLAPYCGYTASLLIGIVFFFLQVSFCKWWAARHKHGPLEGIWHKWTWIRS